MHDAWHRRLPVRDKSLGAKCFTLDMCMEFCGATLDSVSFNDTLSLGDVMGSLTGVKTVSVFKDFS